jgi:hypothetical protein
MREHLAQIRRDQVLAVHPTVPLLQVALHLRALLHLNLLDLIAIVAVKISRRAVVHQIAVEQPVKSRKVVKSVIHAGFVPSL